METPFAPVRSVLAAMARGSLADAPDAELLRRFAADRDGPAFAELVRRYGPLVWRVARTTVGHAQAAEDVFQATFLILAKQAAAVRNPDALAGWLHRTAHRAAIRARQRESRSPLPLPLQSAGEDPLDRLTARELLAAVDEEIDALPEALRAAVVLCGVEGLSQEEAAKRLGWSAGSVKGRLERARTKLRRRLEARGLTIPAALVGVGAAPSELVAVTLAAVRGSDVPPTVAKLVAEVSGMSLPSLWKPVFAAVLAAGGLTFLAGDGPPGPYPAGSLRASAAPPPKAAPVPGRLVLWSVEFRPADEPLEPRVYSESRLFLPLAAAFTPDGKQALVAGNARPAPKAETAGEVRAFDLATGKVAHTYRGTGVGVAQGGLAVHSDGTVAALGYSRAPKQKWTEVVEVWDPAAEESRLRVYALPQATVQTTPYGLAFSPDGAVIAAIDGQGVVRTWDAKTARGLLTDGTPSRGGIAIHPGGRVIVIGRSSQGRNIRCGIAFREVFRGNYPAAALLPDRVNVGCVTFSPDGRRMAAAISGDRDADGNPLSDPDPVVVWDVTVPEAGDVTAARQRGTSSRCRDGKGVSQVAFSPDGKCLAAGCGDGFVWLFDPATAELIAEAKEHTHPVVAVAFSPDGRRLLTAGADAVKVWSVAELLKQKPK